MPREELRSQCVLILAYFLKVFDKVWNVVVILLLVIISLALFALGHISSERTETVRASELVHYGRHHLGQRLGLVRTADDVGVGSDGRLHLGILEVNDLAVVREEVHLLDRGDVGDAKLLEC